MDRQTDPFATRLGRALVATALLAALSASIGCDVDEPQRLISNTRIADLNYLEDGAQSGTLEVSNTVTTISLDLANLPVLPTGSGAWVYEGWIAYEDSTLGDTAFSTGRFTVAQIDAGAEFARGDGVIDYNRDGTFTATGGATAAGGGGALPDSVLFGAGVTFYLTIEPEPDPLPDTPHPTRLLMIDGSLPDTDTAIDLLVPIDFGTLLAGDLSRLDGTVNINTVTGEFAIELRAMGFIQRNNPLGPFDPGVIYQVWFVDDDTTPGRFLSLGRRNPNQVGDLTVSGALNPGDSDGDGIPEPLDFERCLISIEPDGITAFQIVGSGIDTSPDIFETVPYQANIPNVLP